MRTLPANPVVRKRDRTTPSNIVTLLDNLGIEPEKNIAAIVKQALVIIGGECAIYSKLDAQHSRMSLSVATELFRGFPKTTKAKGRICYEVTLNRNDNGMPVALEDLSLTPYSKKDPLIKRYRFRSYLGHKVCLREKAIGTLCVMDTGRRPFTHVEKKYNHHSRKGNCS